jgi:hypothetical protein
MESAHWQQVDVRADWYFRPRRTSQRTTAATATATATATSTIAIGSGMGVSAEEDGYHRV